MLRKRGDKVKQSGESHSQEMDGDSPPSDERLSVEEAARPINSTVVPREAQYHGRIYRPRIIQQLDFSVGSEEASPDIQLRYGSFANMAQVRAATGSALAIEDLDVEGLAVCIGVSSALLKSILLRKHFYYRRFTIPKRSGGERTIEAPRIFLKAIQQWIADYLFAHLQVHDACHSYRSGRSIRSNAGPHIGKRFVACMDIEGFFPSITKANVEKLLRRFGMWRNLASTVSALCTLNGKLPQGAPSSPALSNSYLFDVDSRISDFATILGVQYTRYADDMAFSGNEKRCIQECLTFAAARLEESGLVVNKDKTRLISSQGQQRVTGLVVNARGFPPREFRRKVRAAFNNAERAQVVSVGEKRRLRGMLSYLAQFEELRSSSTLLRHSEVLNGLHVDDGD
jgi:retron-type reverse transcriptase